MSLICANLHIFKCSKCGAVMVSTCRLLDDFKLKCELCIMEECD